jgi:hypothetical protein
MDPVRATIRSAVLVLAVASAAACGGSSGPDRVTSRPGQVAGGASCAAPYLTITPKVSGAGDQVQVGGRWFAADCYDTGQSGMPPPLTNLSLQLSQAGRSWTVASGIDASGSEYTFITAVRLPHDLHPGRAHLAIAGYGRPVTFHVR